MTEARPITFTVARSLVERAAQQDRAIIVTVKGPTSIHARLGEPHSKEDKR